MSVLSTSRISQLGNELRAGWPNNRDIPFNSDLQTLVDNSDQRRAEHVQSVLVGMNNLIDETNTAISPAVKGSDYLANT